MATIKVKRTAASSETTAAPANLEYGELALDKDKLYFGDPSNSSVRVLSQKDKPYLSEDGTTLIIP